MIQPKYLTHKSSAPSVSKRLLDQQVVPMLIDAAGGLEAALEHWAIRVRRSPAQSLGLALGTGALLAVLIPRRRISR